MADLKRVGPSVSNPLQFLSVYRNRSSELFTLSSWKKSLIKKKYIFFRKVYLEYHITRAKILSSGILLSSGGGRKVLTSQDFCTSIIYHTGRQQRVGKREKYKKNGGVLHNPRVPL